MLRQRQYEPLAVAEQLAELFAVTEGLLDDVDPEDVAGVLPEMRRAVVDDVDLVDHIEAGEPLTDEMRDRLRARLDRHAPESPSAAGTRQD